MCVFDYILPELLIIQNTRISFNGIITNNVKLRTRLLYYPLNTLDAGRSISVDKGDYYIYIYMV